MDKTRFVYVDALRGVAASMVVLYHAVEGQHVDALIGSFPTWTQALLRHGDFGVAIFFVLSGFVIAHTLRAPLSPGGALRFMAKRSIRLDPPYWAAIAITILFSALASSAISDRARDSVTIPQLISHLFYLQGILGYKQINSVFWTLCLEIQLYAIYVLLRLTNSGAVLYSAFIASLIWPIGFHPGWPGVFAGFWYAFLLGAGAYLSWLNASLRPWFLVYATVIAIAAIHRSDYFALVSCATAASLLIVSTTGRQTRLLNWRWLQYLGAISYSLYLIHNPVTGAAFRVGFVLTGRTIYTEALWWIMSLIACIAAATLLWLWVEQPSTRLARRLDISRTGGKTQSERAVAS